MGLTYYFYLCKVKEHHAEHAVVAQLVEHQLPKLRVAGSSPVYRSVVNLTINFG